MARRQTGESIVLRIAAGVKNSANARRRLGNISQYLRIRGAPARRPEEGPPFTTVLSGRPWRNPDGPCAHGSATMPMDQGRPGDGGGGQDDENRPQAATVSTNLPPGRHIGCRIGGNGGACVADETVLECGKPGFVQFRR